MICSKFTIRQEAEQPRILTLAFLLMPILLGCSQSPEFGQVTGTVFLDGEPLDMVRVVFMPDPIEGSRGAHSECVTGTDGSYELLYSLDGSPRAIAGWHRVVVEDIAAEEFRDEFRAIRVPHRFRTAGETPLKYEVKPESQSIDLDIPKT